MKPPFAAQVALDEFEAQGRRARRLVDGAYPAGRHVGAWRGMTIAATGWRCASTIVRLEIGGHHATRRAVKVR